MATLARTGPWLCLWCLLAAVPASAQVSVPRTSDDDEQLVLSLAPYGWIQHFAGSIDDTRPGASDGDTRPFASPAIAAGAEAEVRVGATGARFNFFFSESPDLNSRARTGTFARAMTLDALIGYRFIDRERSSLEVSVGVRIAYLGSIETIDLGEEFPLHKSEAWGSGVLGARLIEPLGARWYLDARADVGGQVRDALGGSRTWSYQVAVSRTFTSRLEFVGGYRAVREWRDRPPLRFQLTLNGAFAGVRFTTQRPFR